MIKLLETNCIVRNKI